MDDSASSEIAPVRAPFRAVARTVSPGTRGLDEEGWAELEAIVEEALSDRPPAMRRQLRIFLRVLQWAPLLRWGRRFTSLAPARRRRLLEGLQEAPLLLLRRAVWGLRTLVFMGYYGRDDVRAEIGYDARLRGRRAKEGPTSGRGRGELLDSTPRTGP